MKNLRNSVSLIGRLGTDPEITNFDSGKQKAVFSLATDASYKDKDGKKVEGTDWHRLVVWGGQVKVVEKYLKKGKEICIEGRLTTNTWEDKDGKKHYQAEVIVNDFLMLGGKDS